MSKISKEQPFNIKEWSNYRIITKNLVYVKGLSESIALRDTLIRYEYFGQYGSIIKLIINTKKAYNQNSPYGPSYSAYVTYSKPTEASIAILSLDNTLVDNHLIRASFGTTKYCTFFLRNITCSNKNCVFLHSKANENDIIKRDDLKSNQAIFYDQQIYAIKLADIYNPETRNQLQKAKRSKTKFPTPDLIYLSEIVIENDPQNIKNKSTNKRKPFLGEKQSKETIIISKSPNNDDNDQNQISLLDSELIKSKESLLTSISTASDDKSKSGLSNSITTNFFHVPKIFESKDKSRFNFIQLASSNEFNGDDNEVPAFVQNIINKRTKLLPFTTKIKTNEDDTFIYINSNMNHNTTDSSTQQWEHFINQNKKIKQTQIHKHNDEFIKDFDQISSFIFNKALCK